jgi:hypothetical protein
MTEVKFTMSVPALDALRRIVRRDFDRDVAEHNRIMELPEKERSAEELRQLMRNEHDRGLVERTMGFDGTTDEIGRKK